jgi:CHASE3 domain sensor protein
MIKKIKENFINVSLSLLIVLLILNALLIFYNRTVMIENNLLQKQTEEVRRNWTNVFESDLRRIDLGLRGYALTKNKQILGPYYDGAKAIKVTLKNIDSLLQVQNLDTLRDKFTPFIPMTDNFLSHSAKMLEFVEKDSINDFVKLLNQDKGYDMWRFYSPMYTSILRYQDTLLEDARAKYQSAMNRNVIFQIILVLLAVPSLIGVMYRIRRDAKARKKLLLDFEENNRRHMFDPGTPLPDDDDAQLIIGTSIENLKKASTFIKSIAGGDYATQWNGLNEQNAALNKENLTGDLIKMRDQMKKVKEADEKRIWSTEGLAKFSDVARTNQNNMEKLAHEAVRFLSKHLKAQQASLFIIKDEDSDEPYLELAACYAFDRKKFIQKRIEIGAGLIGQSYLERDTILLTEIPKEYITITSGLGDAPPRCLIIVPMKYNDKVEAVLEMASFHRFEAHEVEFLERSGEVIASSISTTITNERTARLLTETQEQAEAMKAQEEELRQNMEEMQATQENLRRFGKES